MSKPDRPPFIVFDGIDGSGKTTQAMMLTEQIRRRRQPSPSAIAQGCWLTSEPTKGVIGRFLRGSVLNGKQPVDEISTCHLFAADRQDHLVKEIYPAFERDEVVVCDRYVMSTLAYQGAAHLLGLTTEERAKAPTVAQILSIHGDFLAPDLTIVIDVPAEVAMKRLSDRPVFSRYETLTKLERLRGAYLQICAMDMLPDHNVVCIEGNASTAQVAEKVWSLVEPLL